MTWHLPQRVFANHTLIDTLIKCKHNSLLLATQKHKVSSWQIFAHCSRPLRRSLQAGWNRISNLQYCLPCSATAKVTTPTIVPGYSNWKLHCNNKTQEAALVCVMTTLFYTSATRFHFTLPSPGPLHFLRTSQIFHSPPVYQMPMDFPASPSHLSSTPACTPVPHSW